MAPMIRKFDEPQTARHFATLIKFLCMDQFDACANEDEREDGSIELQMEIEGNAAHFTVVITKDCPPATNQAD